MPGAGEVAWIGVVGAAIGGLIVAIPTTVALVINHLRWKRETKLEYLKAERQRLEKMYVEIHKKLTEGVTKGSYPIDMIADILVLTPKEISDKFDEWMLGDNQTFEGGKQKLLDISISMKKHLVEIEKQITELLK